MYCLTGQAFLLHCSFNVFLCKRNDLLLGACIYTLYYIRSALLVLFCSQSVKDLVSPFQEASIKMHPEIPPRLLPESECKGKDFLRTDQTQGQLFSKKLLKKLPKDLVGK